MTQSQNDCHSVIINETPQMQQTNYTTKYGAAVKWLLQKEIHHVDKTIQQSWFAGAIVDPTTGKQMEYKDLINNKQYTQVWTKSFTKELAQLAQGLKNINQTDTIFSSSTMMFQKTKQ